MSYRFLEVERYRLVFELTDSGLFFQGVLEVMR